MQFSIFYFRKSHDFQLQEKPRLKPGKKQRQPGFDLISLDKRSSSFRTTNISMNSRIQLYFTTNVLLHFLQV